MDGNAPDLRERILAARRALCGKSPVDALRWVVAEYAPKVVFTTGFGMEGSVILDLIARHRLPVRVVTLDTGLLFPETREFWRSLEERYRIRIHAIRPEETVEEQARTHGDELWARDPGACCRLRKVLPLARVLREADAWISGIRRDQTPARDGAQMVEFAPAFGVVKVNPLLGWSREEVEREVARRRIPVHPLRFRGYRSIGCLPCTSPVKEGEGERDGRWRGFARTECGLHSPPEETLYPTFLKLRGKPVLVVGGGPVALKKARDLAAAGAAVTLVAPRVETEVAPAGITVHRRGFRPSDLDRVWFVVAAATPDVNRRVGLEAASRRVFVNAVDDPDAASAYAGGVVRRAGVTLAVSTAGRAPALARLLRRGLHAMLPADLSEWMADAEALRRRWKAEGVPMDRRTPELLRALNRRYPGEHP